MNNLHVQWPRWRCQNLSAPISCWKLHQFGRFCFGSFTKWILYTLHSRGTIAMTWPSQDLTIHLFRLNWTFKPFNTNLLTESNLACNLGMWNKSLIWIWLILPSKIASTKNLMSPIEQQVASPWWGHPSRFWMRSWGPYVTNDIDSSIQRPLEFAIGFCH
jgi:hypothetical protein